MLKKLKKLINF